MIVTINTDASFNFEENRGSFAFWIVCNKGKLAKSGMIRRKCSRPEKAEFRCIINAVYCLSKADITGITKIIINTDCLNVIHLVKGNKKAIQKYGLASWGNDLVSRLSFLMMEKNLRKATIEMRHVKSHQSTSTAREWVNDWCDKEAKKQLGNFLNTLKVKLCQV